MISKSDSLRLQQLETLARDIIEEVSDIKQRYHIADSSSDSFLDGTLSAISLISAASLPKPTIPDPTLLQPKPKNKYNFKNIQINVVDSKTDTIFVNLKNVLRDTTLWLNKD